MSDAKTHETRIELDPETGDHVLVIPPGILEDLGWKLGTEVGFNVLDGGVVRVFRAD